MLLETRFNFIQLFRQDLHGVSHFKYEVDVIRIQWSITDGVRRLLSAVRFFQLLYLISQLVILFHEILRIFVPSFHFLFEVCYFGTNSVEIFLLRFNFRCMLLLEFSYLLGERVVFLLIFCRFTS